jgi:hypothetical protein
MRRAGDVLADYAMNLLQFAHQVNLTVQPAGGIDDEHVEIAGRGFLAGVMATLGRLQRRRYVPFEFSPLSSQLWSYLYFFLTSFSPQHISFAGAPFSHPTPFTSR